MGGRRAVRGFLLIRRGWDASDILRLTRFCREMSAVLRPVSDALQSSSAMLRLMSAEFPAVSVALRRV